MKRFFLALAVAFGCVGAGMGGVRQAAAANWTVCATGCSFTTIQKAINSPTVHSGDTIKIRAGTYIENVTIPGTNPNALIALTLDGAGEGATKIDGGAAGTTLYVNSGLTVTISDLTVTNGKAYPASGIVNLVSTLTLEKVTVSGNQDQDDPMGSNAGGIFSAGPLTLNHSTVTNNSGCFAGGIDDIQGTLTLNHTTVSNNKAVCAAASNRCCGNGGGIFAGSSPTTLNDSTVTGNSAGNMGGGIYIVASTVTLNHSTVEANSVTAAGDGGGIFLDCNTPPAAGLTIENSSVDGNLPSGSDINSGKGAQSCPS